MSERWIEIRPGIEVSSLGRLRKYIVGHPDGDGYLCLPSGRRGAKRERIHALVAEAFIGPRPAHAVVRHLNDDRKDNAAINLAYGTRKQNAADAEKNGKLAYLRSPKNLERLRVSARLGGAWWKGKKRTGARGKVRK